MDESGWDAAAIEALVAREGFVRDACAWVEARITEASTLHPPGWVGPASILFGARIDALEYRLRRAESVLHTARQAIAAAGSTTTGAG